MSTWQSALLGLIQGLTEFLPISSSGHLVLFQKWFGLDVSENIAFDVLLHVATLIAVVIVFRRDIADLFGRRRTELGLLALGTVPTVIVGVVLAGSLKAMAENTVVVGAALVATGITLFLAGLYMKKGKPDRTITWKHALAIGLAQAAAIMPGLSRSGLTIAVAIMCGVALSDAVRFSFLLAIPAIVGGAMYEMKDFSNMTHDTGSMIVGFVVALVFGIVSLKIVAASVLKKKFPYFAFYCVPVGVLVIVLSLAGVGL